MTAEPGPMSRRGFLATAGASALAVAGCTRNPHYGSDGGSDGGLSGEVIVTGSSTVFPVSDAIAERFMDRHPNVNVTVDATGTGGGFENHFCPGNSDVNGASRPITDAELSNCRANGVTPFELRVAGDALTVAVNNAADWVECITFEELSQIWRADGARQWSDVRDGWPDEPFELFGPAATSGTYDWFDKHVVGEDHAHTSNHEPTEDDNLVVKGIEDSPYAMGYFGYAYYRDNADRVSPLAVAESTGDSCTPPSLENAAEGSYPLARPLFIYPSEGAVQREEVYEFVKFYVMEAATDVISDTGYVPSSVDRRNANLGGLEEARRR